MAKIETFSSIGHSLSLKIRENGKKDSILLLHGFNDSKDTFIFLEEFLSEHFNLIAFDFRGHGDSEWKKDGFYSYAENIADINNVIDHYSRDPLFILGHSMGGGLAARYTGLFPEKIKGLICLEGFSGLQSQDRERTRIREWLDTLQKRNSRPIKERESRKGMTLEDAKFKLSMIYNKLSPDKIERLLPGLVKETEKGFAWKNDPTLKISSPIPFPPLLSRNLWEQITCPTLIIYGEDSHLMPGNLEEVLGHFKNHTYYEIPNAGHNMHHDNPERVIELIGEYIRSGNFK